MAEQSKYIKQTPVVEVAALKGEEEAEEAEVEDMAEEDVVVLVEVNS